MKNKYKILLATAMVATLFTLPGLTGCGNNAAAKNTTRKEAASEKSDGKKEKTTDIGEEKAKQIALDQVKVKEADVTHFHMNKDLDDGKEMYEVEFTYDGIDYEYEILAADGSLHKVDSEPVDPNEAPDKDDDKEDDADDAKDTDDDTDDPSVAISLEEAKKMALKRVSGATEKELLIELEHEDGFYKYEGEINHQNMEYDFEIDANSGSFLKWTEEKHD